MILLDRLPEPRVLVEKKAEWLSRFLAERAAQPGKRPGSRQYAHAEIVGTLERMSFHKCFYCEQSTKGSLAEVDHHVGVADDPARAFDWDNLYLSCPLCNRGKPGEEAIPVADCVDPCNQTRDPADHLLFEDEIIGPRDGSPAGRATIRKYRLDRLELDYKRSRELRLFESALTATLRRMNVEGRSRPTREEEQILRQFTDDGRPFAQMFKQKLRRVPELGP